MTNNSHLFKTAPGPGRLPLYEGKMIHQFRADFAALKYWVDEKEGRKGVLGRTKDDAQTLGYQTYRLGHRSIASSTNERTFIVSVLPQNVFFGHSINAPKNEMQPQEMLAAVTLLNSFIADYFIRNSVSANLTMGFIYQLPVPRLTSADPNFQSIVQAAARLICTAPEFDDLAKAAGLRGSVDGVTDETGRAALRAELDGHVAHLYGLTKAEFIHILATFPLVTQEVKDAALAAYRRLGGATPAQALQGTLQG